MSTTSMTAKNKAFWKLPKAKQRVAVARDVIASLKTGFYKAKTGNYFQVAELVKPIENVPEKLDNVFRTLKNEGASCQVCGIGACFTSMVIMGDKAKTYDFLNYEVENGDGIDDDSMRVLLRKVFSSIQLTLIECAFEGDSIFEDNISVSLDTREKAAGFGEKYDNYKERLTAIMKNIIKNKGEFIP